jgi:hypothetical protein
MWVTIALRSKPNTESSLASRPWAQNLRLYGIELQCEVMVMESGAIKLNMRQTSIPEY